MTKKAFLKTNPSCPDIIQWNLEKENEEKFSKLEYTLTKGFVSGSILDWNIELTNYEQFSKKELINSQGYEADDIFDWNTYLSKAEQFTKNEFINSPKLYLALILFWNRDLPTQQFTKKEFSSMVGFDHYEALEWNNWEYSVDLYTQKELDTFHIIENSPQEITEDTFNEYQQFIKNCHNTNNVTYKQFIRIIKSQNL